MLKTIKGLLLLFLFLPLNLVYAEVPVILSGPTPTIPSTLSINNPKTFIYTITNNVPKLSFPITIKGISPPVTRTIVANDCGNAIPPGPSTCNIGIRIAPTSASAGQSINQTLLVDYKGRVPLKSSIRFAIPNSLNALLVAAGEDFNNTAPPILAESFNGTSWFQPSVPGLTNSGFFSGADCSGTGNTAVCVAAGNDFNTSLPLIVATTDGGATWSVKAIPGAPTGQFNTASCTPSVGICIAAGQALSAAPLLATSTNGGKTWGVQTITGSPGVATLIRSSCTGSGATAICIVVGDISGGTGGPYLAETIDGSTTWSSVTIPGTVAQGIFSGAGCTGSGATAICVASGFPLAAGPPILAETLDGGITWAYPSIAGLPAFGLFESSTCTGGSNSLCVAVGQDTSVTGAPIIAQSINGGPWSLVSISGIPSNDVEFSDVACTGSGSNAVCAAVGDDLVNNIGTIAVTTNGGASWAFKPIANNPPLGVYFSASCTGSGSSAICIAVGEVDPNISIGPPLIAASIDGGNTWSVQTVPNQTTSGTYSASGATSFKSARNRKPFNSHFLGALNLDHK